MEKIQGYTASQLAENSGKTRHAVECWLSIHKIKPLQTEVLYPLDTLEKLMAASRGRPKKPKAPETATTPKKTKK